VLTSEFFIKLDERTFYRKKRAIAENQKFRSIFITKI